MRFCIHREVLGTPWHVVFDSQTQQVNKTETIPQQQELVLTHETIEELSRLYLVQFPKFPSPAFLTLFQGLVKTTTARAIPWCLCLPHKALRKAVITFARECDRILCSEIGSLDYWNQTYKPANKILTHIHLYPLTLKDQSNKKGYKRNLASNSSIRYSRIETVTGRLKVVSGLDIQTMKRETRDSFSESLLGSLWELDYKSLEPRVLLALKEPRTEAIPEDIYEHIRKELETKASEKASRKWFFLRCSEHLQE